MNRDITIIIPARYESIRFPGKPLVDIMGQSMIHRVYGRCKSVIDKVFVATDDERIYKHVLAFGGKPLMTSNDHFNGTSRCLEAAETLLTMGEVVNNIINVQGDEPFIHRDHITALANSFDDKEVEFASIYTVIRRIENVKSAVFVVLDKHGHAMYFSRYKIPYTRDDDEHSENLLYKHIGTYGYTIEALRKYVAMSPTPLETSEKLEQLRWIENGEKLFMIKSSHDTMCIDTPADLERLLLSDFILNG